MKRNPFLLFLWVCTLCMMLGCSNNNGENQSTIQINDLTVMFDTIQIPISEICLNQYTTLSSYAHDNRLYMFNHKTNSIDIFDIDENQLIENFEIEKEGPNGIPSLYSYAVSDTVFIMDTNVEFVFIDFNGKIKKKIKKNDIYLDVDKRDYTLTRTKKANIGNFNKITVDYSNNELLIPAYYLKIDDLKKKYEGYCIASLDLSSNDISILSIPFPDIFKQKKYYGNLDEPQITTKGDSIIFNFPNSSQIYIYNRLTQKTETLNSPSKYVKNVADKIKFNANDLEIIEHYMFNLFFHSIVYDEYNNMFYRLQVDKTDDKKFIGDRKMYLSVFNDKLESLGEICLPSTLYPLFFVTKKGLLFQSTKEIGNEDVFSIIRLTIKDGKDENKYDIVVPENLENNKEREKHTSKQDTIISAKTFADKTDDRTVFPTNKVIDGYLLMNFFQDNLMYPEESLNNNSNGIVQISLSYDSIGNVTKHEILWATEDTLINEEAKRLLKLVTKVKPDKTHLGISIPIVFDVKKYNENH